MLTWQTTAAGSTQELIDRVKIELDCQKLVPDDGSREDFGRYVRQHCVNPEHPDVVPTMLVFPDGANCPACGWKGDAIDIYRLWHPDATTRQACEALLANAELHGQPAEGGSRELRALDPDQAVRNHLALVKRPDQLAGLMKYGLTPASIKKFKIGLATVGVRLEEGTFEDQERWAVPVFVGGSLKQVIYRKSRDDQGGGKTTMERDAGSWLFNQDAVADAGTLVIVEGWSDVIMLDQWGIPAVTSTNGAGHWRSEWNELLDCVKRVFVGADADKAGSKMTARVKRDIPWAVPVTLPWPAGSKKDWRDGWLAGWRRTDVDRLLRQAQVAAAWGVVTRR